MTRIISKYDIELAEKALEQFKEEYLRLNGWEHTCSTPGSYWLWQKTLGDGRRMLTDLSTAVSLQSNLPSIQKPESWPFILVDDCTDGMEIHDDKYYGFEETGGVLDNKGYDTAQEVIDVAVNSYELGEEDYSTEPEDLGACSVCVLTGRQFIDRIKVLENDLEDYGHWYTSQFVRIDIGG